MKKDLQYRRHF